MKHLGLERAHVVGHSYGGAIAVQLALEAPSLVHSLVLLEPAIFPAEIASTVNEMMRLPSTAPQAAARSR